MTARLGVGVIGLGVGEQHARAFAAHPDCELVALCDMNAAKLNQVAAAFPGARRYARAADLIDDPGVRIVSVASNDDHHAEQIVRALRLGKHVFAEKPLCLKRGDLREIVRAWREARGARLTTNTLLRRSPRFRWLKDAIGAGRLGKVYCIEGDYVYGRLHKLTSGWRSEIPDYSVMLGGGIHVVDLALWLSESRPVEAVAYGSSLGSAHTAFRGTDLALALLRFENGVLARIGANFASVYPHFHRVVVHGTEATFENLPAAVSPTARLWQARDGGPPPEEVDSPYPAVQKGALVPAFVDAVTGRGAADVTEEDVFACVATCLAIEQSMQEGGRPIAIEHE
jgi:predicted dehydrogenase